ncbi:MAG TPA: M48 family metallopeptidase [Azospirillaceae bacterium]|nr:M48 family metallopeptidase [Azospirillaceae bacterium]
MTDDRVSRRTLLAGGLAMAAAGLTATPAAAQLDQLLGQMGSQAGLGDLMGTANSLMKGMDLSEKDEIAMAEAFYPRFIGQSGGLYNSRKAQDALKRFADPILRTSSRALPWEIVLVENETVNAWALPGGKLAVHKGLLRYTASPEELAAVIAHEVAHAELSHGLKQMKNKAFVENLSGIGKQTLVERVSRTQGGALAGTLTGELLGALEGPVFAMINSGYSQDLEYEADAHVLSVFNRTGLDMAKSADFLRVMMQVIPQNTQATSSLYSTHPGTGKRVERLEKQLRKAKAGGIAPGAPGGWAELKQAFPTRKFRRVAV